MKELSAEECYRHIDEFKPIYGSDEKGMEVELNPIPENIRITVWCSNGADEEGFVIDALGIELGLQAFIAKSWIEHSTLLELIEKDK